MGLRCLYLHTWQARGNDYALLFEDTLSDCLHRIDEKVASLLFLVGGKLRTSVELLRADAPLLYGLEERTPVVVQASEYLLGNLRRKRAVLGCVLYLRVEGEVGRVHTIENEALSDYVVGGVVEVFGSKGSPSSIAANWVSPSWRTWRSMRLTTSLIAYRCLLEARRRYALFYVWNDAVHRGVRRMRL